MIRYLTTFVVLILVSSASAQFSDVGFQIGDPGGGPDINEYQRDDGVAENTIGLTAAGSFGWLQTYTSLATAPIITNIRIAFGTPLTLNGAPVTAYLWSDPNQDGNPTDAQVLASAAGVISGANAAVPINNPTFVSFNIPDTAVTVGQRFFLGVIMQTQLAGQFPAAVDQTIPLPGPGVQWAAIGTTGTMNPNALPGVTDISTIPTLAGKWLIRGDGVIPEPTSLALLGFVGLLAIRRR